MKSKILSVVLLLAGFLSAQAQDDTDARVMEIKKQISEVVRTEKAVLQAKLDTIRMQQDKKQITDSRAAEMRVDAETEFARNIDVQVAPLNEELESIMESREEENQQGYMVEDKYDDENDSDHHEDMEDEEDDENGGYRRDRDRRYKGDIGRPWEWKKHRGGRSERRTTSQFVFAVGLNNAITGDELESLDRNGLSISNSRFYEWGLSWKTRLLKNSPLLNIKYGVSFMINNLRPADNYYFAKNGNTTELELFPNTLTRDPYFRMTNLVIPVHLEIDLSKKRMRDDKPVVRTQKGFRLGLGGYAGINTRTRQILTYRSNGLDIREVTKGDYNVSDFIYGVSGYAGYRDISVYTKLDLNSLFDYGTRGRHNISLGVRFDFK